MERNKGFWAIGVAGFLVLLSIPSFCAELNPVNGSWVPVRVLVAGQEGDCALLRVFLKVKNGKADTSSYWTCGARQEKFAEGEVEVRDRELLLFNRNDGTGERYSVPSAKLQRLVNGHLAFQTYLEGEPVTIEFARESNAETIFDIFHWY